MMLDLIDNICITGMGMVSSLGLDVVTCCAAARAGIVRSEELDYFPVRSPDDGAIGSLIGHMTSMLTEGFEDEIRLLRLVQAGLLDLQQQVSQAPWRHSRAAFYLSLPDPRRLEKGLSLISNITDYQHSEEIMEGAQEIEQKPYIESIALRLLQNAARLSGWPGDLSLHFVGISGHTGVSEAIQKAIDDLSEKRVEIAVIGGVDSLLDEDTIVWLAETGRLKTLGLPVGLQPGEAGAFLLLETVQGARSRGSHLLGMLRGLSLAKESGSLWSAEPPTGLGLTEVISGIAEKAGWNNGQPVWLITDHNGESYRAMEWGNAIVQLVARSKIFAEPMLWYPAASFGDTGAASGAVSLCMAISAFARGYAPAPTAAVISSAEGHLRTAILLEMPDN